MRYCLGSAVIFSSWQGVDLEVTHSGGHFFITRRSDEKYNSEILACNVEGGEPWVVREHRPESAYFDVLPLIAFVFTFTLLDPIPCSVKIEHVTAFEHHLAVFERSGGLQRITIFELPPAGSSFSTLGEGKRYDCVWNIQLLFLLCFFPFDNTMVFASQASQVVFEILISCFSFQIMEKSPFLEHLPLSNLCSLNCTLSSISDCAFFFFFFFHKCIIFGFLAALFNFEKYFHFLNVHRFQASSLNHT